MLSTMKTLGYRVITDDIDSEDWNNKTPQQSQQKFQQAGAGGNGHIPLMHETYAGTVNTLVPWLINWAKTNNLKLVTVGMYSLLLLFRGQGLIDTQLSALVIRLRVCMLMLLAMGSRAVRWRYLGLLLVDRGVLGW